MLGKIEGRRRRGWQKMRWLDGITKSMDMSTCGLRELVMDKEALRAAIHGLTKSWTRLSDWIELKSRSELYWKNLYFPRKWRGRQILLVKHCERGEREAVHYTTGHQNCVIGLFFETSELTCVMNVVHGSSALWGWQVHKIVPKLKWSA